MMPSRAHGNCNVVLSTLLLSFPPSCHGAVSDSNAAISVIPSTSALKQKSFFFPADLVGLSRCLWFLSMFGPNYCIPDMINSELPI